MGAYGGDRKHSLTSSNGYVTHFSSAKDNNHFNINDVGYKEIENEVENFIRRNPAPSTIITGSSNQMIEKVENVVKLHNPNYDIIDNGIRIWKEVA